MNRRLSLSLFVTPLLMLILSVAVIDTCVAASKKRTMSNVKREQQDARKSIKETTRKLQENNKRTEQNLQRLNELDGELQLKSQQISSLRLSLDSLDNGIKTASDSITILVDQLTKLKGEYAAALRKMQGAYRNTSLLSFLFSSGNFKEASARYRYLKEISTWRKRKLKEIENTTDRVSLQRKILDELHYNRKAKLSSLAGNEKQLKEMRDETGKLVSDLKKEGSKLQATIDRQQQRIRSLDKELDKMIIAEQKRQERLKKEEEKKKAAAEQKRKAAANRKSATAKNEKNKAVANAPKAQPQKESAGTAADRILTGSFESNKGRLMFPVKGKYSIIRKFGRQPHPDLPNVMTDNTGIDIAVAPGSKARAIFDGTVSGVFAQDGYSKVIMIRHGSYLTIYANLSNINVKVGDKVKANQNLGAINADSQYGNRAVLHFEIRKERNKLNPLLWIK